MNFLFPVSDASSTRDQIQSRLLSLAALFVVLYSLILTLSPAVRAHSLAVTYRWEHWGGALAWVAAFVLAHRQSLRWLPERDPYLLPVAAFLSGWGLLTIWRLLPGFGLRQAAWLLLGVALLILGMRRPVVLSLLQRYKYIWLTSGLLLTALTLVLGVYPGGSGRHLWLGCCGMYLQPSEPLKLLLIVYLAAYLADRLPTSFGLLQILPPTLILFGLALLLLVAQRDLGTALIFIALYACVLYVASGRRRVLTISLAAMVAATAAGFLLFDVVRLRIEAWVNPWLDPSGRSYQIVQSLIAIAAGGLPGRGPGLGSPGLVPVAHSDFVFASIAEEAGLAGTLGLFLLLALLAVRGLRVALRAPDAYPRYLAAGLSLYLGGQAILIIGGNLRLLPLTGVTLPFVSYGGSSLTTSFLALLFLLLISGQAEHEPAQLPNPRPYHYLSAALLVGAAAAALLNGWWSLVRSPDLLARSDNARRSISDRYVQRGSLLDRGGALLDTTTGAPGNYTRFYQYPPLSPVIGYTHTTYGQAGLEASLDPYLRGLQGSSPSLVWWDNLLYGQPPPGRDVRLTLDLKLQRLADQLLAENHGAAVLLNAQSGEVLVMASHPYYDANTLEARWEELLRDKNAPLLNRATQGQYPAGTALGPFLLAEALRSGGLPPLPGDLAYPLDGSLMGCAQPADGAEWGSAVQSGCPAALVSLGKKLGAKDLLDLFGRLGFYTPPAVQLPVAQVARPELILDQTRAALGQEGADVSPLQMALAAAAVSRGGQVPVPRLALSVYTDAGWTVLPTQGTPVAAYPADAAASAAEQLAVDGLPAWQSVGRAAAGSTRPVTWYLGGSLPNWKGTPLAVALVLEQDNPALAVEIGQALLRAAQNQ